MSDGNGQEKIKTCPFLDKPCIGDECAIRVALRRNNLGTIQVVTMCPLPALAEIMSSLVMVMVNNQENPLNLPHLKGR